MCAKTLRGQEERKKPRIGRIKKRVALGDEVGGAAGEEVEVFLVDGAVEDFADGVGVELQLGLVAGGAVGDLGGVYAVGFEIDDGYAVGVVDH